MERESQNNGVLSPARLIRLVAFTAFISLHNTPLQAAFQEALWGARPASMAGAFTAIADDANAPAYNPSGISWITQSEMTFMYAQLYTGLNLYAGDETSKLGLGYFSFVPSIQDKRFGSFAISWSNFAATNLYREDSFALTWADSYEFESQRTRPIVSYGLNLKYLKRSFSTDSRTDSDPVFRSGRGEAAPAVDLGLMLHPNIAMLPGLKFGLSAQNVNRPDLGLAEEDRVPVRTVVGIAYQDPKFRYFNPSLDFGRRNGRTIVAAGVESWVARDTLAFRFGGDRDQFGGGMGYQFSLLNRLMMRLDYALIWPLNVEGTSGSHRVSITTSF